MINEWIQFVNFGLTKQTQLADKPTSFYPEINISFRR